MPVAGKHTLGNLCAKSTKINT
uniref:Uncharacterized protein n=1 Tax=Anguilla anguilla TaxID=7936 RepID=A0A0E9Q3U9_ANGAN